MSFLLSSIFPRRLTPGPAAPAAHPEGASTLRRRTATALRALLGCSPHTPTAVRSHRQTIKITNKIKNRHTHTPIHPHTHTPTRIVAIFLLFTLSGCNHDGSLSADQYQEMVRAFYTGVSALDVGDTDPVRPNLEKAIQIDPEEPAAWADLGLFYLHNSDLENARKNLTKAEELAPQNSYIQLLLGMLESQQGNSSAAIADFQKAIQLDSKNARARYALVQEMEREASPETDAQAKEQLSAILQVDPGNLLVLLEIARLEAKAGDRAGLNQVVSQLAAQSPSWPVEDRPRLEKVQQQAAGGSLQSLDISLLELDNVLKPSQAYQRSQRVIRGDENTPQRPIEQFIRLPSPTPTAAAPDTALTFNPQAAPASSAAASPVDWARALPLSADGPATLVTTAGGQVQLQTTPPVTLPFPLGSDPAVPVGGVAALDWNNDLKPGLVFAGAGGVRLFQQSSPSQWTEITAKTTLPAAVLHGAYTAAWGADIDLDGDMDIVLGSRSGPVTVLRNNLDANNGAGDNLAATSQAGDTQAGNPEAGSPQNADNPAGNPPGTSSRVGTWTPIHPFPGVSGCLAFAWVDLNGDGAPEACIVDGAGNLSVFQNNRNGHYNQVTLPTPVSGVQALAVADVNRDGLLDLVVLTGDGAIRRVSAQSSGGPWEVAPVAQWAGVPHDGTGRLFWADLDNNGAVDLVASGSKGTQVWLGGPHGELSLLPTAPQGRVLSVADMDGSGTLSLVGMAAGGQPMRLAVHPTRNYQWQVIRPRANLEVKGDGKNNSFGVGGRIDVRATMLVQVQPIDGPSVRFGIGNAGPVNVARLVWPNGDAQDEFDLKPDQAVKVKQRLGKSCPWLFAWDGRAMRFVTDLLWSSPLGLRINAQETGGVVQTGDWVKVPGDALVSRNGFYDLRITAELWETHFFDLVRLMAVDHPADTEVLLDERFSIPPPSLQVHPTGPVIPTPHAVDDTGKDVTSIVQKLDGQYLDTFGRGQYQGITRDHYVEVQVPDSLTDDEEQKNRRTGEQENRRAGDGKDQGAVSPLLLNSSTPLHPHTHTPTHPHTATPTQLYLIASGWIHPTDSSINVAISQGHHPRPQSLSLEAQDPSGRWVTVRSNLGFPAGKNKTILISLDGVPRPPAGMPWRLRLRTNLEIYWDQLGFARSLPQTQLVTHTLAPSVADLRYRGFSTIVQANSSEPEIPDYNHLKGQAPQWMDLTGFYTRFGDVRELLQQVDDRYVIMNAGDEIALRFPALLPPPNGWKRDFVFISDGWEKDGDLNTTFSRTVLPLPSHDHPAYNTPPTTLEQDPVYRRHPQDWITYQTRYITPDDFRYALWHSAS